MVTFVPTQSVIQHLELKGLLDRWGEIVEDLATANTAPALGFEGRLRLCGAKYEAFTVPGTHEGHQQVIFLRERGEVAAVPREQQIVGHEVKRRTYGKSYGAGNRWPSTWAELRERVDAHPGAKLVHGGKHLGVTLHGKHVYTLPLTASDRRALLNACQSLRQVGIDVRR